MDNLNLVCNMKGVRMVKLNNASDNVPNRFKFNMLQSYFENNISTHVAHTMALECLRRVRSRRKRITENPVFADTIRNYIVYLHEYNMTVFKISQCYPHSEEFSQLLLEYLLLECQILYKRPYFSLEKEKQVQNKILRLFVNIYNDYFKCKMIPSKKIIEKSAKAIIDIFIELKLNFPKANYILDNMTAILLKKIGCYDKIVSFKHKGIPSTADPELLSIFTTNVITSDYGTDESSNHSSLSPVMEENIETIEIEEESTKEINEQPEESAREINEQSEQSIESKKVWTICLDDDGLDLDDLIYSEEVESKRKEKCQDVKNIADEYAIKLQTVSSINGTYLDNIKKINGFSNDFDRLQQIDSILDSSIINIDSDQEEDEKPDIENLSTPSSPGTNGIIELNENQSDPDISRRYPDNSLFKNTFQKSRNETQKTERYNSVDEIRKKQNFKSKDNIETEDEEKPVVDTQMLETPRIIDVIDLIDDEDDSASVQESLKPADFTPQIISNIVINLEEDDNNEFDNIECTTLDCLNSDPRGTNKNNTSNINTLLDGIEADTSVSSSCGNITSKTIISNDTKYKNEISTTSEVQSPADEIESILNVSNSHISEDEIHLQSENQTNDFNNYNPDLFEDSTTPKEMTVNQKIQIERKTFDVEEVIESASEDKNFELETTNTKKDTLFQQNKNNEEEAHDTVSANDISGDNLDEVSEEPNKELTSKENLDKSSLIKMKNLVPAGKFSNQGTPNPFTVATTTTTTTTTTSSCSDLNEPFNDEFASEKVDMKESNLYKNQSSEEAHPKDPINSSEKEHDKFSTEGSVQIHYKDEKKETKSQDVLVKTSDQKYLTLLTISKDGKNEKLFLLNEHVSTNSTNKTEIKQGEFEIHIPTDYFNKTTGTSESQNLTDIQDIDRVHSDQERKDKKDGGLVEIQSINKSDQQSLNVLSEKQDIHSSNEDELTNMINKNQNTSLINFQTLSEVQQEITITAGPKKITSKDIDDVNNKMFFNYLYDFEKEDLHERSLDNMQSVNEPTNHYLPTDSVYTSAKIEHSNEEPHLSCNTEKQDMKDSNISTEALSVQNFENNTYSTDRDNNASCDLTVESPEEEEISSSVKIEHATILILENNKIPDHPNNVNDETHLIKTEVMITSACNSEALLEIVCNSETGELKENKKSSKILECEQVSSSDASCATLHKLDEPNIIETENLADSTQKYKIEAEIENDHSIIKENNELLNTDVDKVETDNIVNKSPGESTNFEQHWNKNYNTYCVEELEKHELNTVKHFTDFTLNDREESGYNCSQADNSDIVSDWNIQEEVIIERPVVQSNQDSHAMFLLAFAAEIKQKEESSHNILKAKSKKKTNSKISISKPKSAEKARGLRKKQKLEKTKQETEEIEVVRITRSRTRKSLFQMNKDNYSIGMDTVLKPQDFTTALSTKNVKIHQLPASHSYNESTDSDSNDSETNKLFIDDKKPEKPESSEISVYSEDSLDENLQFKFEPKIQAINTKTSGTLTKKSQKPKTPAEKKVYGPIDPVKKHEKKLDVTNSICGISQSIKANPSKNPDLNLNNSSEQVVEIKKLDDTHVTDNYDTLLRKWSKKLHYKTILDGDNSKLIASEQNDSEKKGNSPNSQDKLNLSKQNNFSRSANISNISNSNICVKPEDTSPLCEEKKFTNLPAKLRNKRVNSSSKEGVTIDLSNCKNTVKTTAEKLEKRLENEVKKPHTNEFLKSKVTTRPDSDSYCDILPPSLVTTIPESSVYNFTNTKFMDPEDIPLNLRLINIEEPDKAIDLRKKEKCENDKITETQKPMVDEQTIQLNQKIKILSDIIISPKKEPISPIHSGSNIVVYKETSIRDTQKEAENEELKLNPGKNLETNKTNNVPTEQTIINNVDEMESQHHLSSINHSLRNNENGTNTFNEEFPKDNNTISKQEKIHSKIQVDLRIKQSIKVPKMKKKSRTKTLRSPVQKNIDSSKRTVLRSKSLSNQKSERLKKNEQCHKINIQDECVSGQFHVEPKKIDPIAAPTTLVQTVDDCLKATTSTCNQERTEVVKTEIHHDNLVEATVKSLQKIVDFGNENFRNKLANQKIKKRWNEKNVLAESEKVETKTLRSRTLPIHNNKAIVESIYNHDVNVKEEYLSHKVSDTPEEKKLRSGSRVTHDNKEKAENFTDQYVNVKNEISLKHIETQVQKVNDAPEKKKQRSKSRCIHDYDSKETVESSLNPDAIVKDEISSKYTEEEAQKVNDAPVGKKRRSKSRSIHDNKVIVENISNEDASDKDEIQSKHIEAEIQTITDATKGKKRRSKSRSAQDNKVIVESNSNQDTSDKDEIPSKYIEQEVHKVSYSQGKKLISRSPSVHDSKIIVEHFSNQDARDKDEIPSKYIEAEAQKVRDAPEGKKRKLKSRLTHDNKVIVDNFPNQDEIPSKYIEAEVQKASDTPEEKKLKSRSPSIHDSKEIVESGPNPDVIVKDEISLKYIEFAAQKESDVPEGKQLKLKLQSIHDHKVIVESFPNQDVNTKDEIPLKYVETEARKVSDIFEGKKLRSWSRSTHDDKVIIESIPNDFTVKDGISSNFATAEAQKVSDAAEGKILRSRSQSIHYHKVIVESLPNQDNNFKYEVSSKCAQTEAHKVSHTAEGKKLRPRSRSTHDNKVIESVPIKGEMASNFAATLSSHDDKGIVESILNKDGNIKDENNLKYTETKAQSVSDAPEEKKLRSRSRSTLNNKIIIEDVFIHEDNVKDDIISKYAETESQKECDTPEKKKLRSRSRYAQDNNLIIESVPNKDVNIKEKVPSNYAEADTQIMSDSSEGKKLRPRLRSTRDNKIIVESVSNPNQDLEVEDKILSKYVETEIQTVIPEGKRRMSKSRSSNDKEIVENSSDIEINLKDKIQSNYTESDTDKVGDTTKEKKLRSKSQSTLDNKVIVEVIPNEDVIVNIEIPPKYAETEAQKVSDTPVNKTIRSKSLSSHSTKGRVESIPNKDVNVSDKAPSKYVAAHSKQVRDTSKGKQLKWRSRSNHDTKEIVLSVPNQDEVKVKNIGDTPERKKLKSDSQTTHDIKVIVKSVLTQDVNVKNKTPSNYTETRVQKASDSREAKKLRSRSQSTHDNKEMVENIPNPDVNVKDEIPSKYTEAEAQKVSDACKGKKLRSRSQSTNDNKEIVESIPNSDANVKDEIPSKYTEAEAQKVSDACKGKKLRSRSQSTHDNKEIVESIPNPDANVKDEIPSKYTETESQKVSNAPEGKNLRSRSRSTHDNKDIVVSVPNPDVDIKNKIPSKYTEAEAHKLSDASEGKKLRSRSRSTHDNKEIAVSVPNFEVNVKNKIPLKYTEAEAHKSSDAPEGKKLRSRSRSTHDNTEIVVSVPNSEVNVKNEIPSKYTEVEAQKVGDAPEGKKIRPKSQYTWENKVTVESIPNEDNTDKEEILSKYMEVKDQRVSDTSGGKNLRSRSLPIHDKSESIPNHDVDVKDQIPPKCAKADFQIMKDTSDEKEFVTSPHSTNDNKVVIESVCNQDVHNKDEITPKYAETEAQKVCNMSSLQATHDNNEIIESITNQNLNVNDEIPLNYAEADSQKMIDIPYGKNRRTRSKATHDNKDTDETVINQDDNENHKFTSNKSEAESEKVSDTLGSMSLSTPHDKVVVKSDPNQNVNVKDEIFSKYAETNSQKVKDIPEGKKLRSKSKASRYNKEINESFFNKDLKVNDEILSNYAEANSQKVNDIPGGKKFISSCQTTHNNKEIVETVVNQDVNVKNEITTKNAEGELQNESDTLDGKNLGSRSRCTHNDKVIAENVLNEDEISKHAEAETQKLSETSEKKILRSNSRHDSKPTETADFHNINMKYDLTSIETKPQNTDGCLEGKMLSLTSSDVVEKSQHKLNSEPEYQEVQIYSKKKKPRSSSKCSQTNKQKPGYCSEEKKTRSRSKKKKEILENILNQDINIENKVIPTSSKEYTDKIDEISEKKKLKANQENKVLIEAISYHEIDVKDNCLSQYSEEDPEKLANLTAGNEVHSKNKQKTEKLTHYVVDETQIIPHSDIDDQLIKKPQNLDDYSEGKKLRSRSLPPHENIEIDENSKEIESVVNRDESTSQICEVKSTERDDFSEEKKPRSSLRSTHVKSRDANKTIVDESTSTKDTKKIEGFPLKMKPKSTPKEDENTVDDDVVTKTSSPIEIQDEYSMGRRLVISLINCETTNTQFDTTLKIMDDDLNEQKLNLESLSIKENKEIIEDELPTRIIADIDKSVNQLEPQELSTNNLKSSGCNEILDNSKDNYELTETCQSEDRNLPRKKKIKKSKKKIKMKTKHHEKLIEKHKFEKIVKGLDDSQTTSLKKNDEDVRFVTNYELHAVDTKEQSPTIINERMDVDVNEINNFENSDCMKIKNTALDDQKECNQNVLSRENNEIFINQNLPEYDTNLTVSSDVSQTVNKNLSESCILVEDNKLVEDKTFDTDKNVCQMSYVQETVLQLSNKDSNVNVIEIIHQVDKNMKEIDENVKKCSEQTINNQLLLNENVMHNIEEDSIHSNTETMHTQKFEQTEEEIITHTIQNDNILDLEVYDNHTSEDIIKQNSETQNNSNMYNENKGHIEDNTSKATENIFNEDLKVDVSHTEHFEQNVIQQSENGESYQKDANISSQQILEELREQENVELNKISMDDTEQSSLNVNMKLNLELKDSNKEELEHHSEEVIEHIPENHKNVILEEQTENNEHCIQKLETSVGENIVVDSLLQFQIPEIPKENIEIDQNNLKASVESTENLQIHNLIIPKHGTDVDDSTTENMITTSKSLEQALKEVVESIPLIQSQNLKQDFEEEKYADDILSNVIENSECLIPFTEVVTRDDNLYIQNDVIPTAETNLVNLNLSIDLTKPSKSNEMITTSPVLADGAEVISDNQSNLVNLNLIAGLTSDENQTTSAHNENVEQTSASNTNLVNFNETTDITTFSINNEIMSPVYEEEIEVISDNGSNFVKDFNTESMNNQNNIPQEYKENIDVLPDSDTRLENVSLISDIKKSFFDSENKIPSVYDEKNEIIVNCGPDTNITSNVISVATEKNRIKIEDNLNELVQLKPQVEIHKNALPEKSFTDGLLERDSSAKNKTNETLHTEIIEFSELPATNKVPKCLSMPILDDFEEKPQKMTTSDLIKSLRGQKPKGKRTRKDIVQNHVSVPVTSKEMEVTPINKNVLRYDVPCKKYSQPMTLKEENLASENKTKSPLIDNVQNKACFSIINNESKDLKWKEPFMSINRTTPQKSCPPLISFENKQLERDELLIQLDAEIDKISTSKKVNTKISNLESPTKKNRKGKPVKIPQVEMSNDHKSTKEISVIPEEHSDVLVTPEIEKIVEFPQQNYGSLTSETNLPKNELPLFSSNLTNLEAPNCSINPDKVEKSEFISSDQINRVLEAVTLLQSNKSEKLNQDGPSTNDQKLNNSDLMETYDLGNYDQALIQQIGDYLKKQDMKEQTSNNEPQKCVNQNTNENITQFEPKNNFASSSILLNEELKTDKVQGRKRKQSSEQIETLCKIHKPNAYLINTNGSVDQPKQKQKSIEKEISRIQENITWDIPDAIYEENISTEDDQHSNNLSLQQLPNSSLINIEAIPEINNSGAEGTLELDPDILPNDIMEILTSLLMAERNPNVRMYPNANTNISNVNWMSPDFNQSTNSRYIDRRPHAISISHTISATITNSPGAENKLFSPEQNKNGGFARITSKKEITLNFNSHSNQNTNDPLFNFHGISTNDNLALDHCYSQGAQIAEISDAPQLKAITSGTNDHTYNTRDPVMGMGYGGDNIPLNQKEFDNIIFDLALSEEDESPNRGEPFTNWDSEQKVIVVPNEQYSDYSELKEYKKSDTIDNNLVAESWVATESMKNTDISQSQQYIIETELKELKTPDSITSSLVADDWDGRETLENTDVESNEQYYIIENENKIVDTLVPEQLVETGPIKNVPFRKHEDVGSVSHQEPYRNILATDSVPIEQWSTAETLKKSDIESSYLKNESNLLNSILSNASNESPKQSEKELISRPWIRTPSTSFGYENKEQNYDDSASISTDSWSLPKGNRVETQQLRTISFEKSPQNNASHLTDAVNVEMCSKISKSGSTKTIKKDEIGESPRIYDQNNRTSNESLINRLLTSESIRKSPLRHIKSTKGTVDSNIGIDSTSKNKNSNYRETNRTNPIVSKESALQEIVKEKPTQKKKVTFSIADIVNEKDRIDSETSANKKSSDRSNSDSVTSLFDKESKCESTRDSKRIKKPDHDSSKIDDYSFIKLEVKTNDSHRQKRYSKKSSTPVPSSNKSDLKTSYASYDSPKISSIKSSPDISSYHEISAVSSSIYDFVKSGKRRASKKNLMEDTSIKQTTESHSSYENQSSVKNKTISKTQEGAEGLCVVDDLKLKIKLGSSRKYNKSSGNSNADYSKHSKRYSSQSQSYSSSSGSRDSSYNRDLSFDRDLTPYERESSYDRNFQKDTKKSKRSYGDSSDKRKLQKIEYRTSLDDAFDQLKQGYINSNIKYPSTYMNNNPKIQRSEYSSIHSTHKRSSADQSYSNKRSLSNDDSGYWKGEGGTSRSSQRYSNSRMIPESSQSHQETRSSYPSHSFRDSREPTHFSRKSTNNSRSSPSTSTSSTRPQPPPIFSNSSRLQQTNPDSSSSSSLPLMSEEKQNEVFEDLRVCVQKQLRKSTNKNSSTDWYQRIGPILSESNGSLGLTRRD